MQFVSWGVLLSVAVSIFVSVAAVTVAFVDVVLFAFLLLLIQKVWLGTADPEFCLMKCWKSFHLLHYSTQCK